MSKYTSLFLGNTADEPTAENEPSRYRLLLVDDEPNVLKALRRVFRMENYEVVTTTNGLKALELISNEPFQVVISDYMMPNMDGAELLRRIKNTHPATLRIMLTGHADTGAVMGAINEGAVYKFILKPWNDDDLRITVALALEQYDLLQRNQQLRKENARKGRQIDTLSKLAVSNSNQLAIMLHKHGLLNDGQLQELYKLQQRRSLPVLKLILEREWVAEKKIRDILRNDLMVEEVALDEFQVDPVALELLPRAFCARNWVVPLKLEEHRLLLAVADPMDMGLVEDLRFTSGLQVQTVMANVSAIEKKVAQMYGEEVSFKDMETIVATVDPFESIEVVIEEEDDISLEELLQETEEPPAIRLVNAIIIEAVRLKASDIHIQPRTKSVVVRYRIDGVLADKIHIPNQLLQSLVSRIKIMAELDIAERRRPQDGRITVKTPMRLVDLRISTLPTINGEKVVMRILNRNASIQKAEELGLCQQDLDKVLHILARPQGIIIATGPSGSGKSTTLYSLLQHDASPEKNYVTIEEPVEYFMDLAAQTNVKDKVGLTFPIVLRAILRQDPDVILLGEIRDLETAEVAFHAALTGHMVFSTLHTNSAVATITRLLDLGLKPYVLAATLEGIISQRLVRRICNHCREPEEPDTVVRQRLGRLFEASELQSFRGKGCTKCNSTGYSGRVALFEVLIPDSRMRELVASGASLQELDNHIEHSGQRTVLEDARDKVAKGLTSCQEVLRVLGAQELTSAG